MTDFSKAMLGSVVFTALGVVLLLTTEATKMAWWCIALFGGGGGVAFAKHLWLRRQRRGVRHLLDNARAAGADLGRDGFVAFYGIKMALDPDDDATLEACGDGTDPRCVAAKRGGLQTYAGRMTEGHDHFLYVGAQLAWLGLTREDQYVRVSREGMDDSRSRVDAQLLRAGFTQKPALHLQLEGRY